MVVGVDYEEGKMILEKGGGYEKCLLEKLKKKK